MSQPERFNFPEGRILARQYRVEGLLGRGIEGEVYRVRELTTQVERAAKVLYAPQQQAKKILRENVRRLEKLKGCSAVIRYLHSEIFWNRGRRVVILLSELVEGQPLDTLVASTPGKRLPPFESLSVTRSVAAALQEVHALGEYHGDVHDGNILVKRRGVHFDVKLLDFLAREGSKHEGRTGDILETVRLLYDVSGGRSRYAKQPKVIKDVCRGLRHDLILESYPRMAKLLWHLDHFAWD